jgi:hypothetical protein
MDVYLCVNCRSPVTFRGVLSGSIIEVIEQISEDAVQKRILSVDMGIVYLLIILFVFNQ